MRIMAAVGDADRRKQKLLAWAALGLWTLLILLAAGDTFSASNTQSWTGQAPPSAPIPFTHMLMRVGMHIAMYGVFGGLAYRAISATWGRAGLPAAGAAVLLAFLLGFVDESIQTAHPNRSGSVRDVVLNAAGASLGASALAGQARWGRRRRGATTCCSIATRSWATPSPTPARCS
jgi:VanZ family protein